MFAFGAMAWAHSTSRAISNDQSALLLGSVLPPDSLTTFKFAAARPYLASNVCRSPTIFGSLYASTMAMVWPVPFPATPLESVTLAEYAAMICAGVIPLEELVAASEVSMGWAVMVAKPVAERRLRVSSCSNWQLRRLRLSIFLARCRGRRVLPSQNTVEVPLYFQEPVA